jgi:hypothetical protein
MGAARATYGLGWLLLLVGLVERLLFAFSAGIAESAKQHQVLPYNFLELSLLFFVISIAAGHCCPTAEKK